MPPSNKCSCEDFNRLYKDLKCPLGTTHITYDVSSESGIFSSLTGEIMKDSKHRHKVNAQCNGLWLEDEKQHHHMLNVDLSGKQRGKCYVQKVETEINHDHEICVCLPSEFDVATPQRSDTRPLCEKNPEGCSICPDIDTAPVDIPVLPSKNIAAGAFGAQPGNLSVGLS